MNENELNAQIKELIKEITDSPQDRPVNNTKHQHQNTKENIDKVAQSLDNLRICLKYLLFDLEATRRERDKIKKMFDKLSSNDDKPNKTEGEM